MRDGAQLLDQISPGMHVGRPVPMLLHGAGQSQQRRAGVTSGFAQPASNLPR